MYGMTKYGKLFADELTEWLIEEGFMQSQCQMSIYYKYTPDLSKVVVLSYVDDCVYWYTNEDIGKWFVDNLGKISHVKSLGFAHWFMPNNKEMVGDTWSPTASMTNLNYFLADAAKHKARVHQLDF